MHSNQSHGRLIAIMAVVFVPAILGWGAGFWVSQESIQIQQQTEDEKRLHQISVQAQMLVETITTEIKTIGAEAKEFAVRRTARSEHAPVQLSGRILHWVELGTHGNSITGVKWVARNPLWNATTQVEESYLRSAVQNLSVNEINSKGAAILRIKQDLHGGSEWLSFAYPSLSPEKTILLVLLTPAQAFPSFQRWASHSSGGKSRSYLIGSDGRVLVHSQASFNSADFSQLPFFQEQLRKVFSGAWRGGLGDYRGIDQAPVGSAYFRVESFPLVAVTEELNISGMGFTAWPKILGNSLLSMLMLSIVILGCGLMLRSYLTQVITLTVYKDPVGDAVSAPQEGSQKGYFAGNDFLILDSNQTQNNESL